MPPFESDESSSDEGWTKPATMGRARPQGRRLGGALSPRKPEVASPAPPPPPAPPAQAEPEAEPPTELTPAPVPEAPAEPAPPAPQAKNADWDSSTDDDEADAAPAPTPALPAAASNTPELYTKGGPAYYMSQGHYYPCTIADIDRTVQPHGYTVRFEDGSERSTEESHLYPWQGQGEQQQQAAAAAEAQQQLEHPPAVEDAAATPDADAPPAAADDASTTPSKSSRREKKEKKDAKDKKEKKSKKDKRAAAAGGDDAGDEDAATAASPGKEKKEKKEKKDRKEKKEKKAKNASFSPGAAAQVRAQEGEGEDDDVAEVPPQATASPAPHAADDSSSEDAFDATPARRREPSVLSSASGTTPQRTGSLPPERRTATPPPRAAHHDPAPATPPPTVPKMQPIIPHPVVRRLLPHSKVYVSLVLDKISNRGWTHKRIMTVTSQCVMFLTDDGDARRGYELSEIKEVLVQDVGGVLKVLLQMHTMCDEPDALLSCRIKEDERSSHGPLEAFNVMKYVAAGKKHGVFNVTMVDSSRDLKAMMRKEVSKANITDKVDRVRLKAMREAMLERKLREQDDESDAEDPNAPPPTWTPDSEVSACEDCRKRFSLMRRRHHCRACGGIFCGACSAEKITDLRFGTDPVRVCRTCHRRHEEALAR